jgi:hypothetical protein
MLPNKGAGYKGRWHPLVAMAKVLRKLELAQALVT